LDEEQERRFIINAVMDVEAGAALNRPTLIILQSSLKNERQINIWDAWSWNGDKTK
jgi:hypothetical protein